MSWDVWGYMDVGNGNKRAVTESFNYTHNCNPMLHLVGIDWRSMEGQKLNTVVEKLRFGITWLEAEPDRFIAMNPSNGWGSYETLLPLLRKILDEFMQCPDAMLGCSL